MKKHNESKRITVCLTPSQYRGLKAVAAEDGWSCNALVVDLVESYLGRKAFDERMFEAPIKVRLPLEVHQALMARSTETGRSCEAIMEAALVEYLNRSALMDRRKLWGLGPEQVPGAEPVPGENDPF